MIHFLRGKEAVFPGLVQLNKFPGRGFQDGHQNKERYVSWRMFPTQYLKLASQAQEVELTVSEKIWHPQRSEDSCIGDGSNLLPVWIFQNWDSLSRLAKKGAWAMEEKENLTACNDRELKENCSRILRILRFLQAPGRTIAVWHGQLHCVGGEVRA